MELILLISKEQKNIPGKYSRLGDSFIVKFPAYRELNFDGNIFILFLFENVSLK